MPGPAWAEQLNSTPHMGQFHGQFKQKDPRRSPTFRRAGPSTKLCPASLSDGLRGAMIWYVSSKQGSDTGDGRSLATAFRTLARAVEAASPGDTALIAPGAYDQDLPARVGAARAANIAVAVVGG